MNEIRLLSPDEAVGAIVTGDHSEGELGSLELDADLINLVRSGVVQAGRGPKTNKLVFRRAS